MKFMNEPLRGYDAPALSRITKSHAPSPNSLDSARPLGALPRAASANSRGAVAGTIRHSCRHVDGAAFGRKAKRALLSESDESSSCASANVRRIGAGRASSARAAADAAGDVEGLSAGLAHGSFAALISAGDSSHSQAMEFRRGGYRREPSL